MFLNLIKFSSNFAFLNKILFMSLSYLYYANIKLEQHNTYIKQAVEKNDSSALEEIYPMSKFKYFFINFE